MKYDRIGIKTHYITFYDTHSLHVHFLTKQAGNGLVHFSLLQLVTCNLTYYLNNQEAYK